jgi:hypothetical protein
MEKKKQISVTERELFIYLFIFKKPRQIFGRPGDDMWLPKITTLTYIYI